MSVTHDQTEAVAMGDRIAVMNDGVLQQVGTPEEVSLSPINEFVAAFIGSPGINLSAADVEALVSGYRRRASPADATAARADGARPRTPAV